MLTKEQADKIKALNLQDGVANYHHGHSMYLAWCRAEKGSPAEIAKAATDGAMVKIADKIFDDYIDSITETK
jgi:hypothetical protein